MDELYVYFDAPETDLVEYQQSLVKSQQPAPTSGNIEVEVRVTGEEGYPPPRQDRLPREPSRSRDRYRAASAADFRTRQAPPEHARFILVFTRTFAFRPAPPRPLLTHTRRLHHDRPGRTIRLRREARQHG